jgi:hypothetical protein
MAKIRVDDHGRLEPLAIERWMKEESGYASQVS